MDKVSCKALIEWLDVEIDLSSKNPSPVIKQDKWAFELVKNVIESGRFDITSTESEGEAAKLREALTEVRRLLDWPNSTGHIKALIDEALSSTSETGRETDHERHSEAD